MSNTPNRTPLTPPPFLATPPRPPFPFIAPIGSPFPVGPVPPPFMPPSPFTPSNIARPSIGTPPPIPSPTTISKAPQPSLSHLADVGLKFPTLADRKTAVYVGSISPHLEDDFVQKLLRTCGPYGSWRRLKDDKTKLWKPFGFCEYLSVESAMIALQVLNGMKLEGSALQLKTDAKATQFMQEFEQQKIELLAKRRLQLKPDDPISADQITNEDKLMNEQDIKFKIQNAKRLVSQLFSEQEHVKVELETKQSLSEEQAVQNTIEKIAATGAPPEETETKRAIIADQIRRFRETEKKREREKIDQKEEERKRSRYSDDRQNFDRRHNYANRYSPPRDYYRGGDYRDSKRRRYDDYQPRDDREPIHQPPPPPHQGSSSYNHHSNHTSPQSSNIIGSGGLPVPGSHQNNNPPPPPAVIDTKPITINLQPISLQATKRAEINKEESDSVFGHEEEEEDEIYTRKHKLSNLDEIEREKQQEEEEKKRKDEELKKRVAEMERRRQILKNIPEDKSRLFSFPVNWTIVDKYKIASTSLRDFVNQQIIDLMGGEEVSMTEFVLGKIELHCTPQELEQDLGDVLGEDAESFLIKLWRELIVQIIQCQGN